MLDVPLGVESDAGNGRTGDEVLVRLCGGVGVGEARVLEPAGEVVALAGRAAGDAGDVGGVEAGGRPLDVGHDGVGQVVHVDAGRVVVVVLLVDDLEAADLVPLSVESKRISLIVATEELDKLAIGLPRGHLVRPGYIVREPTNEVEASLARGGRVLICSVVDGVKVCGIPLNNRHRRGLGQVNDGISAVLIIDDAVGRTRAVLGLCAPDCVKGDNVSVGRGEVGINGLHVSIGGAKAGRNDVPGDEVIALSRVRVGSKAVARGTIGDALVSHRTGRGISGRVGRVVGIKLYRVSNAHPVGVELQNLGSPLAVGVSGRVDRGRSNGNHRAVGLLVRPTVDFVAGPAGRRREDRGAEASRTPGDAGTVRSDLIEGGGIIVVLDSVIAGLVPLGVQRNLGDRIATRKGAIRAAGRDRLGPDAVVKEPAAEVVARTSRVAGGGIGPRGVREAGIVPLHVGEVDDIDASSIVVVILLVDDLEAILDGPRARNREVHCGHRERAVGRNGGGSRAIARGPPDEGVARVGVLKSGGHRLNDSVSNGSRCGKDGSGTGGNISCECIRESEDVARVEETQDSRSIRKDGGTQHIACVRRIEREACNGRRWRGSVYSRTSRPREDLIRLVGRVVRERRVGRVIGEPVLDGVIGIGIGDEHRSVSNRVIEAATVLLGCKGLAIRARDPGRVGNSVARRILPVIELIAGVGGCRRASGCRGFGAEAIGGPRDAAVGAGIGNVIYHEARIVPDRVELGVRRRHHETSVTLGPEVGTVSGPALQSVARASDGTGAQKGNGSAGLVILDHVAGGDGHATPPHRDRRELVAVSADVHEGKVVGLALPHCGEGIVSVDGGGQSLLRNAVGGVVIGVVLVARPILPHPAKEDVARLAGGITCQRVNLTVIARPDRIERKVCELGTSSDVGSECSDATRQVGDGKAVSPNRSEGCVAENCNVLRPLGRTVSVDYTIAVGIHVIVPADQVITSGRGRGDVGHRRIAVVIDILSRTGASDKPLAGITGDKVDHIAFLNPVSGDSHVGIRHRKRMVSGNRNSTTRRIRHVPPVERVVRKCRSGIGDGKGVAVQDAIDYSRARKRRSSRYAVVVLVGHLVGVARIEGLEHEGGVAAAVNADDACVDRTRNTRVVGKASVGLRNDAGDGSALSGGNRVHVIGGRAVASVKGLLIVLDRVCCCGKVRELCNVGPRDPCAALSLGRKLVARVNPSCVDRVLARIVIVDPPDELVAAIGRGGGASNGRAITV